MKGPGKGTIRKIGPALPIYTRIVSQNGPLTKNKGHGGQMGADLGGLISRSDQSFGEVGVLCCSENIVNTITEMR